MRARPVDFRAKASLIALARAQCFRGARIIDRGPLVPNVFFVFARNQMTYINQSNAGSFLFLLSELLAVRIGSWAPPGFKINVLVSPAGNRQPHLQGSPAGSQPYMIRWHLT